MYLVWLLLFCTLSALFCAWIQKILFDRTVITFKVWAMEMASRCIFAHLGTQGTSALHSCVSGQASVDGVLSRFSSTTSYRKTTSAVILESGCSGMKVPGLIMLLETSTAKNRHPEPSCLIWLVGASCLSCPKPAWLSEPTQTPPVNPVFLCCFSVELNLV